MQNNMAFVCKLGNIQRIEGADKIVSADIILNGITLTQVVVGVDTREGTEIVYFDSNLCIEQAIIDSIDKLAPDYGTEEFKGLGAYLSKGNRVRCIKLKGCISNGLAVTIDKFFQFFPTSTKAKEVLQEGYSFTKIGEQEVCKKYLPPVKPIHGQGKQGKSAKRESKIIPDQFHFHIDTDQLLRNVHKLHPDQVISASRKIHGTSSIVSNCKVRKPLSLFERVLKFIHVPVIETTHEYVYASRAVIKNEALNPGGFYGTDLWSEVGKAQFDGKLHKGESVYYEIVGYIPGTQKMIQKGYRYGCNEGEYKIAVYRVTMTNEDGIVTELGWEAMKQRCREMNVPTVQEYYFGRAKDWNPAIVYKATDEGLATWQKEFVESLKRTFLEKKATDCDNAPDEGIVLRVEGLNIEVYKLKSESFLLRESKAKDEGEADMEDQEQAEGVDNEEAEA